MRVINVSLNELETKVLLIGFEGENQITQVRIDAAEILTDYPNATPTLIAKPLFGFAYPVIVTMEGTDVVWEIDNSVLSFHGDGEIQLTFTEGTVIAKSYVGRIRIKRSLSVNGEAPDPIETWEQAATAKLAEVDAQIGELEDMVDTATDAATRAEQSASTASAEATSAAGSAATAASSATNANTAKTDAQTAKTAAETAQEKAEEAQAAAEAAAQTLVIDDTLTQANQAAEAKTVGDALKTKAEIDGYYQDMTVGDAEQLVSSQFVEDKVPYKFRTSGGSADIGNRAYVDKIVGGTVAWNQFAKSNVATVTRTGITWTNNGDGTYTASGTATADSYIIISDVVPGNHVVYFRGCPAGGASDKYYIHDGSSSFFDIGNGILVKKSATITTVAVVKNGFTANNLVFKPQVFDLTQMFGSAVADAVYAMEQATAGAGVAWFRAMFPDDYYEYNAGELISVSGLQSHDMVGFNQWDEEWEVTSRNGMNSIWTKNYVPVLPNTAYCINMGHSTSSIKVNQYDKNKTLIKSSDYGLTNHIRLLTTESNCAFILVGFNQNYGSTYQNDVCINLAWSGTRNGEYQPYVKHSYPLDSSLILRGIPKLSADNQLYFDGDEYLPEGKVNRRYGVVDLGTLSWTVSSTSASGKNRFTASLPGAKQSDTTSGATSICKYIVLANAGTFSATQDGYTIANNGVIYIFLSAYQTSSANDFTTAMSGVYLVYELDTPTEETAEAYQAIQLVDDWGTEEYVSGTICPVGHETRYPADLVKKLEGLPTDIQVNGESIVQDGVANVPIASRTTFGVAKVETRYYGGVVINSEGALELAVVDDGYVQEGRQNRLAITPSIQHRSAFYGLAKAAGSDEKNSTLPVGQYTDEAKDKIMKMIGILDMIAPYESTGVATRAYSTGDCFIQGGKLYRATASISIGVSFSDSNCEQTTLMAEINR